MAPGSPRNAKTAYGDRPASAASNQATMTTKSRLSRRRSTSRRRSIPFLGSIVEGDGNGSMPASRRKCTGGSSTTRKPSASISIARQ